MTKEITKDKTQITNKTKLPRTKDQEPEARFQSPTSLRHSSFGTSDLPNPCDPSKEDSMRIGMVLTPLNEHNLTLAAQIGVTDVVARFPGESVDEVRACREKIE